MAEAALTLTLCAPTHAPVDVSADEVVIPGEAGVFTVLPGHTPLLTTLTTGVLIAYGTDEGDHFFAVHDGFASVLNNHITVLANVLELADEIDAERAQAAVDRANEALRKRPEDLDIARVESALGRSLARLEAHGRQSF